MTSHVLNPPAPHRQARLWRVALLAGVTALTLRALFGGDSFVLALGLVVLVLGGTLLEDQARRAPQRRFLADARSPWALGLVAALLTTLAAASEPDRRLQATYLVIGASVLAIAVASLLIERLRATAFELLTETAICVAAVAFLGWALVVQPRLDPGVDTATAALGASGLLLAIATIVCVSLLAAIDPDARRWSTMFLGSIGMVFGAGGVALLTDSLSTRSPAWLHQALALIALTLAGAAALHPSRDALRIPALRRRSVHAARRAAITLSAVLVGPFLIALPLVSGVRISVPFAAAVSTVLSLTVSAHVLRLLRRWDALEHDVHHDSLTGLPNRQYCNRQLLTATELAKVDRRTMAVMFLDLDRFKNVNDSLGHAAGNALLTQVAHRLREAVDDDIAVARLGGDEFAILVPRIANYQETIATARSILDGFSAPFDIGRRHVYVTPSIGVAHYPADGLLPSELLEHADAAMYRAKERGRNTVELYTAERRGAAVNRLDLESALHRAIAEDQLGLEYQPKVNIATGRVIGVEALARWNHPWLGAIPPDEFIPVAEESGLIGEIGEWVLLEACAQGRRWLDSGNNDLGIAVNLSPRQFQLHHVPDLVARVLRFTKLPPELLELEITESLALQDPARVSAALDELREMGVRCSIDDFGVGYSGLGYIDRFAIDAIKIDRQFVGRINASGAPIVTAVIAMARGLQIEAVAEGVETVEQLEFLRGHGCDTMQGFLLSRPLPSDQVERLFRVELIVPGLEIVHQSGRIGIPLRPASGFTAST